MSYLQMVKFASTIIIALWIGHVSAQDTDRRCSMFASTAISAMTLEGRPTTDLTTPWAATASHFEMGALWRTGKDTAAWGHAWSIGGSFGVMRWGQETVYPLRLVIIAKPWKRLDRVRLDASLGGAFGPWKSSSQGHVRITMINEGGVRYRLIQCPQMSVSLRVHFDLLSMSGPMRIHEENEWRDAHSFATFYAGCGLIATF